MKRLTATRHDRDHEIEILAALSEIETGTVWWALPGGICVAYHLMRLEQLGHVRCAGRPKRFEITAVGREYLDYARRQAS